MQSKRIGAALLLLGIVFWGAHAIAGDIEAGTFSVGASSNAVFVLMDDSDFGHDRLFGLDTEFGYFFHKNWEIGVDVGLRFRENSDFSSQWYSLLPYLGYHWSMSDKSNIYGRIGGGYGLGYTDYEDSFGYKREYEVLTIFAEVGYEYFISKNVSLGFGVRGERSEYDEERDWGYEKVEDDDTTKELSTRLSFKLYF